MVATRLSPPIVPGYTWRALRLEDAPALHQLELECVPIDGGTDLSTVEQYRERLQGAGQRLTTDTVGASDSAGRLAASAWVSCDVHLKHEYRAFLNGRVHPDYRSRGVGSFLLQWMEVRACEILSAQEQDRPAMLRVDFYDRSADAVELLEKHGFRLASAEDTMRRDLSHPLPAVQLPEGMTLVAWSEQRAAEFFEVYEDAFRERPRFPGWSEETWRHNLTVTTLTSVLICRCSPWRARKLWASPSAMPRTGGIPSRTAQVGSTRWVCDLRGESAVWEVPCCRK